MCINLIVQISSSVAEIYYVAIYGISSLLVPFKSLENWFVRCPNSYIRSFRVARAAQGAHRWVFVLWLFLLLPKILFFSVCSLVSLLAIQCLFISHFLCVQSCVTCCYPVLLYHFIEVVRSPVVLLLILPSVWCLANMATARTLDDIKQEALDIGYEANTVEYRNYLSQAWTEERARQEKERDRQHQLAVLQAQASLPAGSVGGTGPTEAQRLLPPHPAFDPEREPLDRFLTSYERYCSLIGLSGENTAVGLTNLLPSNLRLALDNLDHQERKDFQAVRAALLRAGAYTQEACRRRYRDAEPTDTDTTRSYLARKAQYLQDWLDSAKVPTDGLREFLIIDDFLHRMPPEFAAYVREEDSYEIEEVAKRSDRYLDLYQAGRSLRSIQQKHRNHHNSRHQNQSLDYRQQESPRSPTRRKPSNHPPVNQAQHQSTQKQNPPSEAKGDQPYCTYHRIQGHTNAECRSKRFHPPSTGVNSITYESGSSNLPEAKGVSLNALRLGTPVPVPFPLSTACASNYAQCLRAMQSKPSHSMEAHSNQASQCHRTPSVPQMSHRAPLMKKFQDPAPVDQNLASSAATKYCCCSKNLDESKAQVSLSALHSELPPAGSTPAASAGTSNLQASASPSDSPPSVAIPTATENYPADLDSASSLLPSCNGEVNGHTVPILLDSGAEGLFVDSSLVHQDQFLGQSIPVRFPEGPPVTRPLCNIQLQCPYYTGPITAIALDKPSYPVYLGPMPGSMPIPRTIPPAQPSQSRSAPSGNSVVQCASLMRPTLAPSPSSFREDAEKGQTLSAIQIGGSVLLDSSKEHCPRPDRGAVSPKGTEGPKIALDQQTIDPQGTLVVRTRACKKGIRAELLQRSGADSSHLAPVAQAGRRLRAKERKFPQHERQALSIYWAVRQFQARLRGHPFTIAADAQALQSLQSADHPSTRIQKWGKYIKDFHPHPGCSPEVQNHHSGQASCTFQI